MSVTVAAMPPTPVTYHYILRGIDGALTGRVG